MKVSSKILLKLRELWKKYWRYIIVGIIVWIIVILINNYLKTKPKEIVTKNTYNPDKPVIEYGGNIDKSDVEIVNNTIDEYFNYCNNKEYQKAFEMLTQNCKNYLYNNDIKQFMEYVDDIYNSKKIYNVQNYSNVGNVYIYEIRILDDVISSGTTGGYQTYKEKMALIKDGNEFKITNQGYMDKKEYDNIYGEDEFLKIKVLYKNMSYEKEEYNVQIQNKSDKYIIIANGLAQNEVTLNLGDQSREALDLINNNIILSPGESIECYLLFDKFFDDQKEPKELNFNYIRIIDNNITKDEINNIEPQDANKIYSMNIPLI